MAARAITTVFFDLGDTLGTATLTPPPLRLATFQVFPFVLPLLTDLSGSGLKLGIISNTGDDTGADVDRVLGPTGVLPFFVPRLRIYSRDVGMTKADPAIFALAADRAGEKGALDHCLFVGEDARERATAQRAGMAVCPHPLLVREVIDGQALRFARLTPPRGIASAEWQQALCQRPLVPLSDAGAQAGELYSIASQRTLAELTNMGFALDLLGEPDLPDTHELFLLRDDAARASGFTANGQSHHLLGDARRGRLIVSTRNGEMVLALPPDMDLGEVHLEQARHGHTVRLLPDPLLLPAADDGFLRTLRAAARDVAPGFAPSLTAAEIAALAQLDANAISDRVARFSGHVPLATGAPQRIVSRHVSHADNQVASSALAEEFHSIGQGRLDVRMHKFTHRGRSLFNVEAELRGVSPELVLVTAHLDSTAAFTAGFDESTDPAPGADDDGSGVAAVLAIAERFVALSSTTPPARTIRFVLFNAEEEGLVGSKAYARAQRAADATIVAVFQMDMIGYNPAPPRSWEVHAGFMRSREVENRSVALARLLEQLTPIVSPDLERPQIYRTQGVPGGDPADDRSDHSPFQAHGYAACVATEDFFAGPNPDSPPEEENPNYHTRQDSLTTVDGLDPSFAASIARAIAAAAWVTASVGAPSFAAGGANSSAPAFSATGDSSMSSKSRQIDTRKEQRAAALRGGVSRSRALARPAAPAELTAAAAPPPVERTSALTGAPANVTPAAPSQDALVDRALAFVRRETTSFGFSATDVAEFVPDPVVQRTSSGSAAVHLHQRYRGLPVFQMTRTVRFNPQSQPVDAAGDSAPLPPGLDIVPKLDAGSAVLKAAQHLAATSDDEGPDQYGQSAMVATIDAASFEPKVAAAFPGLAARPTVFEKGPFENPIPAYLLIFNQVDTARLAWHIVLTLPDYNDQYVAIVAADNADGEILYCKSTVHRARARGKVFEFNPGVADRRFIDFPRPIGDYPVTPSVPLFGFPSDWVSDSKTLGNSTLATLNTGSSTLTGTLSSGTVVFDPSQADGDDQKLLNIFYFCNYMHDFLFILGFDESSGNFQLVNATNTGLAGDPVRARAHSGPVNGTANMATGPDGLPPLMNMGLVTGPNRHTAFDADVVFHEYVHGLTNRLAGGPLDTGSMTLLQPGGLGEGYSDYFALTLLNFFRSGPEKTVVGDWVVNSPRGIRRAPYDENYPFKYGDMSRFPEEHDMGEVWCAALMSMTRRTRTALGNQEGYRLSWQIVVDGLKLVSGNPTYLEARDGILRALDDLRSINRITAATHAAVRKAAWQAFARFGMGVNAFSPDPDDVDNIVGDSTLPPDLTT